MPSDARHHPRVLLITGGCGFIGMHLVQHLLRTDPVRIGLADGLEQTVAWYVNLHGSDRE
jgi:dTDP-D-glucose 4,6-dehydratase